MVNENPGGAASQPQPDVVKQASYSQILEEHDVDKQQRDARKKILIDLESSKLNPKAKRVAVIGHISHDQLEAADIPILGNVLRKIGDVDLLTLILHSPGGDGTVVEKFVGLCRTQCKRFNVAIPTEAKSAGTLIALGADQIIMGPPSEIGPIDAQILITVSGVRKYVSAQSFIDARDNLLKKHAEAVQGPVKQDTSAILAMLSSLDLPFIVECERQMEFGRDVGKKLLANHMLRNLRKDAPAKAEGIAAQLSSVELHKVHGRTIDGAAAKRLGLTVRLCRTNDPYWCKIWEWYTRAEIMMRRTRAFKLFETTEEQLMACNSPPG